MTYRIEIERDAESRFEPVPPRTPLPETFAAHAHHRDQDGVMLGFEIV